MNVCYLGYVFMAYINLFCCSFCPVGDPLGLPARLTLEFSAFEV